VPSTNGTTDGTKIAFLEGTKGLKVSPRVLKTEFCRADSIRLAWSGAFPGDRLGAGCADAGPRILGRIIEALLALLAAVGHFFGKGGL
jgi:hypothetical protein